MASNREKCYGAGVIFHNEEFRANVRRKLQSNFVIIPSSIHETITIPCIHELDRETLLNLVHEVKRNREYRGFIR